jgi:hypothetical protein
VYKEWDKKYRWDKFQEVRGSKSLFDMVGVSKPSSSLGKLISEYATLDDMHKLSGDLAAILPPVLIQLVHDYLCWADYAAPWVYYEQIVDAYYLSNQFTVIANLRIPVVSASGKKSLLFLRLKSPTVVHLIHTYSHVYDRSNLLLRTKKLKLTPNQMQYLMYICSSEQCRVDGLKTDVYHALLEIKARCDAAPTYIAAAGYGMKLALAKMFKGRTPPSKLWYDVESKDDWNQGDYIWQMELVARRSFQIL